MEKSQKFITDNKPQFLTKLFDFLRIPSVSADSSYNQDVRKCAEWVESVFNDIQLDNVKIIETPGHPTVYGEKIIDPNKPTVLVYGHYDVQPADPIELWDSEPFNPVIKDEKIYARGACDDKGQVFMHIAAAQAMIETNELPCNVKFLIEGEEEVGSDHLEKIVRENTELLSCDTILISDTSLLGVDTPSITAGLKGLAYLEVEVTGPGRDLHSGTYGGSVGNPINILCDMIASMKDSDNKITIPGFYDKVIEVSPEERAEMAKAPFNLEDFKSDLNIEEEMGEKGYSTMERTGIRPTLDVNGIWGGYIGEGAKTVLPSKAFAKISMRLVPNQSSEEITKIFQDHFNTIAPKAVKVKVTPHHGGEPVVTDINSKGYIAASKAMEKTFNKKPIPVRTGGSIPIVALFKEVLKTDAILMGFGLDTDAIHSPNEHYGLFNFYRGIETIPYFYHYFSE